MLNGGGRTAPLRSPAVPGGPDPTDAACGRVEVRRLKEKAAAGRDFCISEKNINSPRRINAYLVLSGERLIIRFFDKFSVLPRHAVLAFISVPDGNKNAIFGPVYTILIHTSGEETQLGS